jgi:ribose 5-phosphate isomerase A
MSMDGDARLSRLAHYVASTIPSGITLGLGSGSTAEAVIRALGERVRQGDSIAGVPTSRRTADLAHSVGIKIIDFERVDRIELGIDGADEISPQLDLVKGRGGALLREKLVALACDRFIIVASSEKLVHQLGTRLPLPVEIVPFGWDKTAARVKSFDLEPVLRCGPDEIAFVTDSGNYILDCTTGPITDPSGLGEQLKSMTGVVDHGLFVSMAHEAIVIDESGQLILVIPGAQSRISTG